MVRWGNKEEGGREASMVKERKGEGGGRREGGRGI